MLLILAHRWNQPIRQLAYNIFWPMWNVESKITRSFSKTEKQTDGQNQAPSSFNHFSFLACALTCRRGSGIYYESFLIIFIHVVAKFV